MVGDYPPSKYATSNNDEQSKGRREYRSKNQSDGDRGRGSKQSYGRGGGIRKAPQVPWRLPDRWDEYTTVGKVIPEARVICFKTPLKGRYFGEDSIQFGTKELLSEIQSLGGELGLIVDLTYTTKYYDPDDFTDKGIEYKKIFCPGRDFEELEKLGGEFVETLKEFFECNKHNDKWVGVHCTHGLNRTGYLVCRYLHEALDWPMDEAINKFEESRGHPIDRAEYLDQLRKMSLE